MSLALATPSHRAALPGVPAYVRTADQMVERVRALETRFPDYVRVTDIGDSVHKARADGGHDILAATLTAPGDATGRPVVQHIAGLHPAEWANPHLLLTWAEQTLQAARDGDPAAKHLLATTQVDLVPFANPDGYAAAIADPGNFHRTNANGVDLNRNFPGTWNPQREPNAGKAPASEPEIAAITSFGEARRPTLVVDWHSQGGLVLRTPADRRTDVPSPTAPLGAQVAAINGYRSIQAAELYPTWGTSMDFAEGELGATALAVETGVTHHQPGQQVRSTLSKNLPALDYLASVAPDPARMSTAPRIDRATVNPKTGSVTAWTSPSIGWPADAHRGVELLLDPTQAPGTGIALEPRGQSTSTRLSGRVAPSALAQARDGIVWLRTQAAEGWGPLTPVELT